MTQTPRPNPTPLPDYIVSDDADKYLATLSSDELCPKFGQNGLPETTGSFTREEIELALNVFCP